jgi:hypothetical protein
MQVELIPSARRLIRSLRDIGYEFVDAVADIVDNSIEAEATVISITLKFEGEDSYLTIADNGVGMSSKEIQEALRFGSSRTYGDADDLGRYGLGLKTASLSQCERLTVSARRGEERARINSFCWDLDHIDTTNRWEILKVDSEHLKDEVWRHLHETTGTVVTWERLGRLLEYKYPSGEYARRQVEQMAQSLKLHLGMVFHRFLSGEIHGKRIAIYINDERVSPWDPYSRGELHTQKLDQLYLPLDFNDGIYNVRVQPYILPPQSLYSSPKAHLKASGPGKWNKHQGLYIYRSNRIIQAGGWSGLRTSDEHTKLLRIAVFIPSQLDELFQVNVAKKHLALPRELRTALLKEIQPMVQRAQEVYRDKMVSPAIAATADAMQNPADEVISRQPASGVSDLTLVCPITGTVGKLKAPGLDDSLIERAAAKAGLKADQKLFHGMIRTLFETAEHHEKLTLQRILERYLTGQDSRLQSKQGW